MPDILRFDFGPAGKAMEGYIKVTAADAYDAERGYGFTDCSLVTGRVREGMHGLEADFCIPLGTSFVVDVPGGTYLVSILLGDAAAPTCTTLRTNGERLVLYMRCTAAGQFVRETFTVDVWGEPLKLIFSGITPRVNAVDITHSS
ncbi:hypothetical protein J2T17_001908 [Paenibacillus mucilaginosus]|uniref:GDSL family lipase n=1 Tax=Paenibacillus mucilaginosus TaxID=61624 RepID=UPI003D19FBFF